MDIRERIREIVKSRVAPVECKFPGADVKVGIRLLTESEVDAAGLDAQRYIRDKLPGFSVDLDPTTFDRERQRQILWKAVVKPDGTPFFDSPRELRDLDTVIVNSLFDAYLEVQETRSPFVEYSPEKVDAAARGLATGEIERELGVFDADIATLRAIVRALARRLVERSEP